MHGPALEITNRGVEVFGQHILLTFLMFNSAQTAPVQLCSSRRVDPMSLGLVPAESIICADRRSKVGMASKRGPSVGHAILRKKFRAGMTFANYRDKEVVFSQGDLADSVFYIESGTVKLTAVTSHKKAIIAILRQGSFFGEGCLAGQSLRICTARSIGQSNIIRLQKERTVRTLKQDPQFARLFVEYLLSRVVRIEEDLIDQFFNFSERRLARVLLLFGEITKESKADSPLKVSQSTLAEMVGTTRPRVSKFMNDFKKKGMVSYNGGVQINNALIIAFLQNRPMSVKKT